MVQLYRTNSENKDFHELIQLLDAELSYRYGEVQKQQDKNNKIDWLATVVVAYWENTPAGCGCYKEYDTGSVEIKRMFVKPELRGKGIASKVLNELEQWAKENHYSTAILETGIQQPEAIGLYEKLGYRKIDNFGPYVGNPNSVCMNKSL